MENFEEVYKQKMAKAEERAVAVQKSSWTECLQDIQKDNGRKC
jgi:uncharacterized protein